MSIIVINRKFGDKNIKKAKNRTLAYQFNLQPLTEILKNICKKISKKVCKKFGRIKKVHYLCTRNQKDSKCLFSSVGRARHS